VINKLNSELSDADINAVLQGNVPSSVTHEAFQAGVQCAAQ
jgi:fructose-1-phosphate kinase PfkB-like protein